MKIESAKRRQAPNHFRKHSESDDYLQVGLQSLEFSKESLVLQFLWLQDGNAFLLGKLLDRTALQDIMMPSDCFVGHRNDTNHLVAFLNETFEALHREVGRAHEDYTRPPFVSPEGEAFWLAVEVFISDILFFLDLFYYFFYLSPSGELEGGRLNQ